MARTLRTMRCGAPGEAADRAVRAVMGRHGFVQVLRANRRVWRRGIPCLIPLQYIQVTPHPGGLELQIWTLEQFFGEQERDLDHSMPPIRKKLNQLLTELETELRRLPCDE